MPAAFRALVGHPARRPVAPTMRAPVIEVTAWPGHCGCPDVAPESRRGRGGSGELTSPCHADLPLFHVATHPNHAIAAHDGVHWVRLTEEGLSVRGQNAGAGVEVPAGPAVRMAVDHPHGLGPPCLLATLPRHHVAAPPVRRIHIGGPAPRRPHRGAPPPPPPAAPEPPPVPPALQAS